MSESEMWMWCTGAVLVLYVVAIVGIGRGIQ